MRGLSPYAWRSLTARPARSLLTVAGISIGVAVLVTTLAVSAGMDDAVDRTVAAMAGRADLRVEAFTEDGLTDATVDALASVPGIAVVAPAIERQAFLERSPGQPLVTAPVTVLGVDPAAEPEVHDLDLVAGVRLQEPDEEAALVTERLAAQEGISIASRIAILGAGRPVSVRVVGIVPGDGPVANGSGRTVILPIRTAMRLGLADGDPAPAEDELAGVTRVDAVLAKGASIDQVSGAVGEALRAEPYVLSVPRDMAASLRASTADLRGTMALLASITLFAAAFMILNTLALTVVERIRELALLRAAGASRGQITRVVVLQALALGLAGSITGIAGGVLLARLVTAWLRQGGNINLEAPRLSPEILVAGLVVGLAVTLVAAIEPARRAASVAPVIALRARSDPGAAARAHAGWMVAVIAIMGLGALLVLPVGEGSPLGPLRAILVYVILLGAVLVTPLLLAPLGRIAGLPFSVGLRLEERLARAAIARDRSRTALTVGTLVVGLAMVVALGSVQANARVTATSWLADVVPGDEVLTAIAPAPVGEGGVDEQLLAIDGVASATPLAAFDLAFDGARLEAMAVVGSDLDADGRLQFTAGDRTAAFDALDDGGAVILPRATAESRGLTLGDVMAVSTAGGLVELRVAGIVDRTFPGRAGDTALVGWRDAQERFGVLGADAFAVRYDAGPDTGARSAVAALAAEWALSVAPISVIAASVAGALDRVFGLLDLIALAAVVIAALGIVNTLSMDTFERTRELGMLRAAGMSRRQVWRSVLVEAGIIGAIGALVGSLAGLAIGALLVVSAGGRIEAGLQAPVLSVLLALALGVPLAMLAAAQPARVAGRQPIAGAVLAE
jgi:putative ABC transport system permease protein